MFATFDHYRAWRPAPVLSGATPWTRLDIEFDVNFFVAQYSVGEADAKRSHSVIISSLEDLRYLLRREGGTLIEVQMATPPSANRPRLWKVEPLAKVWECTHPDAPGETMRLFQGSSGTEYLDDLPRNEINRLVKVRQIYPFSIIGDESVGMRPAGDADRPSPIEG
ncbi:MAG: hypothetical protein U1F41_13555 [Burkholderiales bacterium]